MKDQTPSKEEEKIAIDTLERYSGSRASDFEPYLLLTNFPQYVEYFAKSRNVPILQGSMFTCAHSPKEGISILDFKIGSPAAALVIDLVCFLPVKATLVLGMCGGLRRQFKVGEYFVPIASIRGEGTSDFYFAEEVPAMANFMMQKTLTTVMENEQVPYRIGITHTTNKRFWEFNEDFREMLQRNRPQAIEMECATLFTSGYFHKLPVGALLLISDLPLGKKGIKTKASAQSVFDQHTEEHVEIGAKVMVELEHTLKKSVKGVFRGYRRRFEELS